VRLKIVGHFPEGTLQAMASGCAQIDVIPAKSHDELMPMLADAIIMILPSRNEGLPRILIEGMIAALPVVGSDVAGIPELIRHGENGFVVPDGDVPMLEQRLRELLSDPALRHRMGRRSYELARATLTESVYRERFVQMLRDTIG
jgi:glycosyltransferase involved in cell wall biosynthesis